MTAFLHKTFSSFKIRFHIKMHPYGYNGVLYLSEAELHASFFAKTANIYTSAGRDMCAAMRNRDFHMTTRCSAVEFMNGSKGHALPRKTQPTAHALVFTRRCDGTLDNQWEADNGYCCYIICVRCITFSWSATR